VTVFDLDAEVSKGHAKNIFGENRGEEGLPSGDIT
jgi:hypothetical protein